MGTWTAIERPDSRKFKLEDRWADQVLERSWILRWTPADANDTYSGDAAMMAEIPNEARPQYRLDSTYIGTSTPYNAWLKYFICRTCSVEPMVERPFTWLIRSTYTNYNYPYTNSYGVTYLKQTRTVSTRRTGMYRQGATFPTNGSVTWPTGVVDIGGTKVDTNGNPRTALVPQQAIQIELLRDRTPASSVAAYTADDPNWGSILTDYISKRNSAVFLGWEIGSVLCTGITATLDSEMWRIQASFLFDRWYHLEQVPIPNLTGQPVLFPGATVAGQQINQTTKVGWYQQFSGTADLNDLFDTAWRDQLTKAGPLRLA
jgi:hypothetical protein